MGTHRLVLYKPHSKQLEVHNSKARYRTVSFGRQGGKSTMCINELLARAWELPNTKYWMIEPIYSQARDQYRKMLNALPPEVVFRNSDTEMRVELVNGSCIDFKSGETLDNLRGATLHGVVIDEVRDHHPDLWPLVIRPMLTTTKGWGLFVSTPRGFDAFYDLYNKGVNDPRGEWQSFSSQSTCNPLFTQEEFESARRDMSEAEFAQEILAEFRSIHQGKVYLSEGQHNRLEYSPFSAQGGLFSPHLPITLGCDFNVNPMSWHLGQFRGSQCYWFDEIHVANTNTQQCAEELVARLVALREQGAMKNTPHVKIVGDSSGNSRNTKANESDYGIITTALSKAGFKWTNDTPDANPPVKTRVNTMNARLKAADGSVSFWYHPTRCPMLKKDFERVSWKQGAENILDQVTDRSLTHASDSVGYPECVYAPLDSGKGGTKLRVINR